MLAVEKTTNTAHLFTQLLFTSKPSTTPRTTMSYFDLTYESKRAAAESVSLSGDLSSCPKLTQACQVLPHLTPKRAHHAASLTRGTWTLFGASDDAAAHDSDEQAFFMEAVRATDAALYAMMERTAVALERESSGGRRVEQWERRELFEVRKRIWEWRLRLGLLTASASGTFCMNAM